MRIDELPHQFATATQTPLTDADLAALERESWIDQPTAEQFGLRRVDSPEGAAIVGRTDHEDYEGIVYPVYWPGEPSPKEYFIRRDHPSLENHHGTLKPRQKYLAPPGRGNRLLFGPCETADVLTNTDLPLLLVEGLKKTYSGMATVQTEQHTAALSGMRALGCLEFSRHYWPSGGP